MCIYTSLPAAFTIAFDSVIIVGNIALLSKKKKSANRSWDSLSDVVFVQLVRAFANPAQFLRFNDISSSMTSAVSNFNL